MITFIGDVHGKFEHYLNLIKGCEYSIQLGDFGFDWSCLNGIDATHHKILGGNHDNYNECIKYPHYLGDYGLIHLNNLNVFFVRGALSIDRDFRREGVSWWRQEELSMRKCYEALDHYKEVKPNIVISHACPTSIIEEVTESSNIIISKTSQLLESMLELHCPDVWIFGHYHKTKTVLRGKTTFSCLGELEYINH